MSGGGSTHMGVGSWVDAAMRALGMRSTTLQNTESGMISTYCSLRISSGVQSSITQKDARTFLAHVSQRDVSGEVAWTTTPRKHGSRKIPGGDCRFLFESTRHSVRSGNQAVLKSLIRWTPFSSKKTQ